MKVAVNYFPTDVDGYVKFAVDLIDKVDPASRAMCVVAHENLRPMLLAAEDAGKKVGKPFQFDDMLVGMHRRLVEIGDDPVNSRRFLWFVMAMHVMRLDQIASHDPLLSGRALGVWLQLADAGRYIANLLANNVVWRAEEKVWFDLTKTEKDGRRYVVTMAMPKAYRSHPRAAAFAEAHDFLLLP